MLKAIKNIRVGFTSILMNAFGSYAASYVYFGTSEGDGADYGFWPDISSLEEDARCGEVLKVSDTSDVPRGHYGYVMSINDHGNVTLYRYVNGRSYYIWECV